VQPGGRFPSLPQPPRKRLGTGGLGIGVVTPPVLTLHRAVKPGCK